MGSKVVTPSVIAKLMGLDELPNQSPVQKPGRVLSEKYYKRVASIVVRERSPSPENYLFRMNPEKSDDFSPFLRVLETPRQDKLNMEAVDSKELRLTRNIKFRCSEETSRALGNLSKISFVRAKVVCQRPHRAMEQDSPTDFSRPRSREVSTAGSMKFRDFLGSSRYRMDTRDGTELLGQRPRVTSEEVEEISKQMKSSSVKSRSLGGPSGKKNQHNLSSVTSSHSSYIAMEAKKEISERFTMMKELQDLGSGSRGKTLGEMLSMHSGRMKPRNLSYSSRDLKTGMKNRTHDIDRLKRSKISERTFECSSTRERGITSKDDLRSGKVALCYRKSRSSHPLDSESNSNDRGFILEFDNQENEGNLSGEKNVATLCAKEADTTGRSLGAPTNIREMSGWNSQIKEPLSASATSPENLANEEETTELFEDEFMSSYSSVGPESFKSIEEAYQPSPDSVLEPFGEEISGMQILPFKLESLEQCLEEHRMTLSSEGEDNGEPSLTLNNFEEKEDSVRFLRPEQSRDFSYLVDVLSEAGLHSGNLIESLSKWHSTESPIDSSVFEVLEKKYDEHKSWRRSERKLLFDRINLGMTEFLMQSISVPSWAKLVSAQISSRRGSEAADEAIWVQLVKQENEAGKDSGNVLGDNLGWSNVGECVDIVSREIEKLLFEELETEFF